MNQPPLAPHLSDSDVDRFRRQQLSAGELVAVSDHLEVCDACRQRVADTGGGRAIDMLDAAIGRLEHHVSEDDVHAYVSGTLDEQRRRDIESHLQHCGRCADEISDLQRFADRDGVWSARVFGSRTWWFAGLAAAVALAAAATLSGLFRSAPAQILMTLNDGSSTVTVDARGNLNPMYALDPAGAATVRQTLLGGRLTVPPAVLALGGADSGRLRGPADNAPFRALAPIATAVQSDRPTLRWTALAPDATYIVRLHDETNGTTITSEALRAMEWTPAQTLARGDSYVWQVEASAQGHEAIAPQPPAPAARFVVLSTADAERLSHAPPSHLVRGILYANAGAIDDAERELGELRAQNPRSVLAQQLSDQIAEARRSRH